MKKHNLKESNLTEIGNEELVIFLFFPRDSILSTHKGFVDINNGSLKKHIGVVFI